MNDDFNWNDDSNLEDDEQLLVQQYEDAVRANTAYIFTESQLEEIIEHYLLIESFSRAFEAVDIGLAQYKFTATFHMKKAEVYLAQEEPNLALECLEMATIFSPKEAAVILLKSDAYVQKKLHKKAVNLVTEALENASDTDKIDLYLELVDIYEDWDKNHEVLDCLEACLKLDPFNEEALDRIMFSISLSKDYARSIAIHNAILDEHAYHATAWYNLGLSFNGLNKIEEAIEAFEFAIVVKEDHVLSIYNAALAYIELEKYEKGIEYLKDLIELKEGNSKVYFDIINAYKKSDKPLKARYYLKELIRLEPNYAEAYHELGLNYLSCNLPKNSLYPLKKALELSYDSYEYHNSLAAAYFLNDKKAEALAVYEDMILIDDSDKRIYLNIVSILYELDRVEEAIDVINAALYNFEDSADLLYIKTAFLYDLGKKTQMFDTLVKALDTDAKAYYQLYELIPEIENDAAVVSIIESFQQD